MARIETPKGSKIIVTQNNDSLKSFAIENSLIRSRIKVKPREAHAVLFLKGSQKRKLELSYGSGYLSQSSRSILINGQVDSVQMFDTTGKMSRRLIFNKPTHL
jgi:hypothetical protein